MINHLIIPKVGTFVMPFYYYYYFNSSSHFEDAEAEVQGGLRSCRQGRIHSFFSGVYPGPVPREGGQCGEEEASCVLFTEGRGDAFVSREDPCLLLVEPWEVDGTSLRKYMQELEP